MPVDPVTVLFADALEEVACNPYLIASFLCALGKDLEFPLASCDFSIDAFNIEAGCKALFEMLFNHVAAKRIACTHGAIVLTLWIWVAIGWETKGLVGIRIVEEVFLLEAEPEIVVVVINQRTAVGRMSIVMCIENITHHKECWRSVSTAAWIRTNKNRPQLAV